MQRKLSVLRASDCLFGDPDRKTFRKTVRTAVGTAYRAAVGAANEMPIGATFWKTNGTAVCASDQTTYRTAFRQAQWPAERPA